MMNLHKFRTAATALLLLLGMTVAAQGFTNIPGPMGTTRCLIKGQDGRVFLGSSSRGVLQSSNAGNSWSTLGGNTIMTGRVNDLLIQPNGALTAATEQGGVKVWDGTAWANMNNGLASSCGIVAPVRALAFSDDGLFAGTYGNSACFPLGGIFHFDGTSWANASAGLNDNNTNALAVSPTDGHLYAGTNDGVYVFDGSAWHPLPNGLGNVAVRKLRFAPNGDLFAGTDAGLALLTANATSWVFLNNGLPNEPVFAVAVDESPLHLLVGTGFDVGQAGHLEGKIFESFDGGNSWAASALGEKTTVVRDFLFLGGSVCLATGLGILKSVDNGQQWQPANTGFTGRSFNTFGRLAVSKTPSRHIFYGTDDGVFRYSEQDGKWVFASEGIDRHIVTALYADRNGYVYCGAMRSLSENSTGGFGDGALYRSLDLGGHWEPVAISKDWRYVEIAEMGNGDLICAHGFGAQPPSATIVGSSLSLSSDQGAHWADLDVSSGMAFCCAASPTGTIYVAGESQSVYRSVDGGASFELIVAPGQEGNVGVLEVSDAGDVIMGSGGTRTLYFSTDGGASFTAFDSPVLPNYVGVKDVAFDAQGKAYCTTTGVNGAPSLFTIDVPFTKESPFTPISGLNGNLFNMTWDECGFLHIYHAGGVFRSEQALRPPVGNCLPSMPVRDVAASPLFEASPNPASQSIYVVSKVEGELLLQIWDMRGQLVAQYTVKSEGEVITVGHLAAGTYWLKALASDGRFALRKWVVAPVK